MDNIAQSMRFSPSPRVIYRKRKPELALGENQRKAPLPASVAQQLEALSDGRSVLNCHLSRRDSAPAYDAPEAVRDGSAILTHTVDGSRR